MEAITLAGHPVGPGHPPYVIAEVGSNHNGDMRLCRRLVDAAAHCGAHAVKFQSWSKGSLICKAEYRRNTEYADTHRHFGTLEQMVEKYQFTPEQHREIADYCRSRGIEFISTPFSMAEADLLDEINVPYFKIASMDVNHPLFLQHVARKGKPVVLSTGMATLGEVESALATLRGAGATEIALLHCVSIYPPDPDDVHLNNIRTLARSFDVPVGFSDHTIGTAIPLAAAAAGACIIEKHFTLDKQMKGWDHWISADPDEMKVIVEQSDVIRRALGSFVRTVSPAEMDKRLAFRRCVVTARPMKKGETVTLADIDFKRPGRTIGPDQYERVLGRTLLCDMAGDTEIPWENLG